MNEVFKAVDSDDEQLSYFYFDGKGKQMIVDAIVCNQETFINHVKTFGARFDEEESHRARMIDPVLVATW